MTTHISHTAADDAPLSAAKRPDAAAAGIGEGDALIGRTVTINRPRAEVYAFWRNFENLPRFMESVEGVSVVDDSRSRWIVSGPAGRAVEWDAIITEDEPDRLIAWRSAEGADVDHTGRIEFRDSSAGRGTEVTATILYDPPAGSAGKWVAKLFQKEPKTQVRRDLRRFKQLLETGEVSTAKPGPAAPRA
jgi:uncharacterized membrane protein